MKIVTVHLYPDQGTHIHRFGALLCLPPDLPVCVMDAVVCAHRVLLRVVCVSLRVCVVCNCVCLRIIVCA